MSDGPGPAGVPGTATEAPAKLDSGTRSSRRAFLGLGARHGHRVLLGLILGLLGLLALPKPLVLPTADLDPSHAIGIRLAALKGWQFGQDIIFSYGPLGWIGPMYVDYGQWLTSLIVSVSVHVMFLIALFFLVAHEKLSRFRYLALLLLAPILVFLKIDYRILLLALILLYLALVRERSLKSYSLLIGSTAFLAIASLYKFNMMLNAIAILAMLLFFLPRTRGFSTWLITVLSYSLFVVGFWVAAGQEVVNLPRYLSTGIQLSSGYSSAMAYGGPSSHLYLAGALFFFVAGAWFFSYRHTNQQVTAFMWIVSGPLLLAFKHGYIRHDGHILLFFGISVFALICLFFISTASDRQSWIGPSSIIVALIFLFATHSVYASANPSLWIENFSVRLGLYRTSASLISKPLFRDQIQRNARRSIHDYYATVRPVLATEENESWDIFPWEVSLLWSYNLDWRPRPVFQSYSAYTPKLDKENARSFSSRHAPTSLVYRYGSIDDRYPLFDEPLTVFEVLRSYQLKERLGDFLILTRRRAEKPTSIELLGETTVRVGESFTVPAYNEGRVFAKIEMELSQFGRALEILYKPAATHIQFTLLDGSQSRNYRFVPAVAVNPVLVSDWIDYSGDLAALLTEKRTKRISSIRITADNVAHYSKALKVTFLGVKGL